MKIARWYKICKLSTNSLSMLLTIFIVAAAVSGFFAFRAYQNQMQQKIIQKGDIAILKSSFTKDFPLIPTNNILHILDVDAEFVNVEYINFKDGTYNKQKLNKEVLRKVRHSAA